MASIAKTDMGDRRRINTQTSLGEHSNDNFPKKNYLGTFQFIETRSREVPVGKYNMQRRGRFVLALPGKFLKYALLIILSANSFVKAADYYLTANKNVIGNTPDTISVGTRGDCCDPLNRSSS